MKELEKRIKEGKRMLEDLDIINEIKCITKGLVSGQMSEIVKDFVYMVSSLYAPDIHYLGHRSYIKKRPQENIFIYGTGSVGINTLFNVCSKFVPDHRSYTRITQGGLTAMSNNIAKQIDHNIVFLSEFYANNKDLVNDIKSIIEENMLRVGRSHGKGMIVQDQVFNTQPAFYIGCNSIPRMLDNPFISRFDGFFRVFADKNMYEEITDSQINSIHGYKGILELWKANGYDEISTYKNCFQYLKLLHDFKEKYSKKAYNNIIVDYDDISQEFRYHKTKFFKKQENANIFPRDVEAGIRRINSSAWLNLPKRDVTVDSKCLVIHATRDDLFEGIEKMKQSYNNKDEFFRWRAKKSMVEPKNLKAKTYYVDNFQRLKGMSLREQERELKGAGFEISYNTCRNWRNELNDKEAVKKVQD